MLKKLVADENERIDKFLSKKLDVSRNQIEALIKKSFVKLNSKEVKKGGVKLNTGDVIEVSLPETEKTKENFEVNFDIEVLYED